MVPKTTSALNNGLFATESSDMGKMMTSMTTMDITSDTTMKAPSAPHSRTRSESRLFS